MRTRLMPCARGVASSPISCVNETSSMNSHQSRRDFLRLCGLAGLSVAAPFWIPELEGAEAPKPAPYEGPYYVVFNASGGWDTTYLMDPKGVGEINRLYKDGDILTKGNHKFAPTAAHKQG